VTSAITSLDHRGEMREGQMAARGRADKQLVEQLKTVPLFSGCSDRELASLGTFLREVSFPAGREIVKKGQTGTGLHVIVEGETKVVVGDRTRRRLGPGAFFGEISLLDRGPRTATVVAETPVRTLSLSSWNFRAALKEHPSLAVKMLEELASRIRTTGASISD
jgi:CRP/FNR family transcriptional regulator, cyclic AMP receptor protein